MLAILAAALWLDNRIKTQAPFAGYCPASADTILYGTDFGQFWGDALDTEQVQRVRSEWRRGGSGIELEARNLTGVRPTPSRWRLWMGHRFLVATTPAGYGVCTYPGLLMRGVSAIHGWFTEPIDADGVRAYGDVYFAWRDGFIIASLDPDYVRASLTSDAVAMKPDLPARAVRFESRVDPVMSIEVYAADEFPIVGQLATAMNERSAPMTLPNAWSTPPIASCSATAWSDIATVLATADDALSHSQTWSELRSVFDELFETWELHPPTWQDERLDHCSLALIGLDVSSNVPYPELAFAVRSTLPAVGDHPLAGMLPTDIETIPYEWGGYPGTLYPMAGSQWAPCLGRQGRDWLGASRERAMRELTGRLAEGAPVDADFTLQIDWAQVSAALVKLITQVEDLELIPEMDRDEVRTFAVPFAQALRHLGRTAVLGESKDGVTTFEGRLARRAPEHSP